MRGLLYFCIAMQCLADSGGFIMPFASCLRPVSRNNVIALYNGKQDYDKNTTKTNITKIMKMDFTEETEEEMLHKPKYVFGLSEIDMILIRIYVYLTVSIYFVLIYLEKMKK